MPAYVDSSRFLPVICTLCWAKVDPPDKERHTRWHENVERVPALSTDYPPIYEIPKQED